MNNIKYHIKNITGLAFKLYCELFRILDGITFIFMYHRVKDSHAKDYLYDSAMFVTNQTLDMHVAQLSKYFNIVPIDEIGKDNKPQCVLTFDDGWADNYYYALPILTSHGVPATIFVTVNYIDTNRSFWFHNIWLIANHCLKKNCEDDFFEYFRRHIQFNCELKLTENNVAEIISALKAFHPEEIELIVENALASFDIDNESTPTMLTWSQVSELQSKGIAIGSHGMNHYILTRVNNNKSNYEITESLSTLKNRIKTISEYFCYPNGNYDKSTISAVKDAGYIGAIGTELGYNTSKTNKYCLNRIAIHDDISSTPGLLWFRIFQAYLKGRQ